MSLSVLDGATLPLASLMRGGKTDDPCLNSSEEVGHNHVSFFEANMGTPYEGFCPRRFTLFQDKLPKWSTGLDARINFASIPNLKTLNRVLGSTWWRKNVMFDSNKHVSREYRKILWASTGKPLEDLPLIRFKDLLEFDCNSTGLHRLKNFILTLDGLNMSLFSAGAGIREMNNWKFFDRVSKSYLAQAVGDMYKTEGSTYYSELKAVRGYIKDKALKERAFCKMSDLDSRFWYFKYLFRDHFEGREILTLEGLHALTYVSQTRAVGLPPRAVKANALDKFVELVTGEPPHLDKRLEEESGLAVSYLSTILLSKHNYSTVLNRALMESKISISNSSCAEVKASLGGKVESARQIFTQLEGKQIIRYDLHTGEPLGRFLVHKGSHIAEVLFHFAIYEMLRCLNANGRLPMLLHKDYTFFDTRVKVIEEPGKARIITMGTLLHAVLLHPLAHVFSVIVSSMESSHTGMRASNHGWDFYKRLQSHVVPDDDIFGSAQNQTRERFMCSEDWTAATDNFHPKTAATIVQGLTEGLGLPKFYGQICSAALTQPRNLFSEDGKRLLGIKRQGIMMGDPLTKQVLHIGHLISRLSAENANRYVSEHIPGPFLVGVKKDGKEYKSIPVYSHEGPQQKGGVVGQAWRFIRNADRVDPPSKRMGTLMTELKFFSSVRDKAE